MAMTTTDSSQTTASAMTSTVEGVTEWGDAGTAADRPWDTSDPFFTAQTRDLIVTVFVCYIQHVILYIGSVGNVVCCLVFWKQGLSDRINLLLFWLAVVDFLNLSTQLPTTIICYTSDTILINNVDVIVDTKISRVYVACGYVSGCLIVVMSIERCLFVVIPFKARRLLTYRSMVIAIVLSYLIPVLAHLPLFLADTVRWRQDPTTNRSMAYRAPTSWFPEGRFPTLIPMYFLLIGQPASFVAVVVCSIITIVHLRRTSMKRSQMMGKSSEEGGGADNRLTVMLLFICIANAVLCLCQICSSIIHTLVPEFFLFKKYHNSFVVFYQAFVFTASCVNSTINFCAYLVLSTRFRATLKEMCPCLVLRR